MMNVAFVFPGTGSQYVGMGERIYKDYQIARRTFEEASDILGFSMDDLCFKDYENKLMGTKYGQLAVVTCAIAAFRILEQEDIVPSILAGFSVGQYSAFVAGNVMTFHDALKIVNFRGELMESQPKGATIAIMGLVLEQIRQIRERAEYETGYVLDIALHNSPTQFLLSGQRNAVDRAIELARNAGAFRITKPNVNLAVHSRLMEGVIKPLNERVSNMKINCPEIPIILNSSAEGVKSVDDIRKEIISQCTSTVLWVDSVRKIAQSGIKIFIETGAGNVLKGLNRFIRPKVTTFTTNNGKEDIDIIKIELGIT